MSAAGTCSKFKKGEFVAIKMHFGERGNDGYIKPEFVRPFIKELKQLGTRPFLTDTNTIYSGPRNNAADHLLVASEHGFATNKLQVAVIIADGLRGDDYDEVPINGNHFKKVKIGRAFTHANGMLVLSHFKGHLLTGFGGAIKNLGMGCGSRAGKFEMHSSSAPTVAEAACSKCGACVPRCAHGALTLASGPISIDKQKCVGCGECAVICPTGALSITWDDAAKPVQEKCAEYALGAVKNKKTFFVNFVNHITPNCDCMSIGEKCIADDVGILASEDPVAIDKASFDLIVKKHGNVFADTHPLITAEWQCEYAEKVGLGKRDYELIEV